MQRRFELVINNRSYTLGNNHADNIVAVAQAQMGKTKAAT